MHESECEDGKQSEKRSEKQSDESGRQSDESEKQSDESENQSDESDGTEKQSASEVPSDYGWKLMLKVPQRRMHVEDRRRK
jgi:hypothetical protein